MDVSYEQVDFMGTRVAGIDGRWEGETADLVTEKEKVYADYALLRTTNFKALPFEDWAKFLDRRWDQYADVGFTYSPTDPVHVMWKEFWNKRIDKEKVAFHIGLLAYTENAVMATKQKLRVLAEKADRVQKVWQCVSTHSVHMLHMHPSNYHMCVRTPRNFWMGERPLSQPWRRRRGNA